MSEDGNDPDAGPGDGVGGLTDNGGEPVGSASGEPPTNGEEPGRATPEEDPAGGTDAESARSFEEVQQFRQRSVWAVIAAVSILAVATVVFRPTGPALTVLLLVLPAVGVSGTYLANLRTEVREDGLYVRLWPLHRSPRHVPFAEVTDQETVEFRAYRDYGGIGIRRTPDAWAYLVGSGGGVRVERGEEDPAVVVGSARPEELERAIAAGVARTRAAVEGDDQPRWRAVADFQQSPGETGAVDPGEEAPASGESADDPGE